ncbi:MAG: hypothetical protein RL095_2564 [Verrucomicrobiota bacterium]|jgi:hypothetical protein
MSSPSFSPAQLELLADLVLIGIYSDGHLAISEEAALGRLLASSGPEGVPEREAFCDAATTRVRRLLDLPAALEARIASAASVFSERGERAAALHVVNQVLNADGKITSSELHFLARVKKALQN